MVNNLLTRTPRVRSSIESRSIAEMRCYFRKVYYQLRGHGPDHRWAGPPATERVGQCSPYPWGSNMQTFPSECDCPVCGAKTKAVGVYPHKPSGINSASDIPTSDTNRERNVATLEMMGIALPRVGRAPICP